jgi:hypothetical protein
VTEYGKVWVPGDQPPAGLSDAELQAWQHMNPNDYGYAPSVWDYLGNPSQGTGGITATAPIVAPNQTGPESYLENGQTYTNAADATTAMNGGTPATATTPSTGLSGFNPATSTASDVGAGNVSNTALTAQLNGLSSTDTGVGSSGVGATIPTPVQTPMPTLGGVAGGTSSATGTTGATSGTSQPIPTTGGSASYSLTPTTPDNALSNSTITPGAGTDRFAIAQQQYNDWQAQTDPQFQAAERDRLRYAAANGAVGQGATATSINDIAAQREADMRTKRDTFLNDALTGSIEDAYRNIGIAQQQQGVQIGQQNTAFGQQVTAQQLMDSEQGQQWAEQLQALGFNAQQIQQAFENAVQTQQLSDSESAAQFYQAYEQYVAGTSGNPVSFETWLAGQYARPAAA